MSISEIIKSYKFWFVTSLIATTLSVSALYNTTSKYFASLSPLELVYIKTEEEVEKIDEKLANINIDLILTESTKGSVTLDDSLKTQADSLREKRNELITDSIYISGKNAYENNAIAQKYVLSNNYLIPGISILGFAGMVLSGFVGMSDSSENKKRQKIK